MTDPTLANAVLDRAGQAAHRILAQGCLDAQAPARVSEDASPNSANAYRRPGAGAPDEEPHRTSFMCACCGRVIAITIEGLYYNPPVGRNQSTGPAAGGPLDTEDPTAGAPRLLASALSAGAVSAITGLCSGRGGHPKRVALLSQLGQLLQ